MHEAGHGLYAHGIAPSLERTPLATSPSLGLNESQSRTWENLVGRSRPFWTHWYEPLQETFPGQLGDVGLDDVPGRRSTVPSRGLIRVEADETTYSLHIILRFELEQQLIEGTLDAEGPARGVERRDAGPPRRRGAGRRARRAAGHPLVVSGGIGYFPTYALGNVISLQIWAAVRDAIPDLDAQMEAGELETLSAWLRDNLYSLGRKFTPKETIERITGSPTIDPQPYLAYLREKLAALARQCLRPSVELVVNGELRSLEIEPRTLLVHALRDGLGLTGAHVGCDTSQCGACTVLLDGRAVKSCTVLALQADGSEVTTIEGLARGGRAPPDPARVRRAPRAAVRVLHAGCDPDRIRSPRARPRPERRRRSGTRCAGISAAARATRRSSSRCARRPRRCARRQRVIPASGRLRARVRPRAGARAARRARREGDSPAVSRFSP